MLLILQLVFLLLSFQGCNFIKIDSVVPFCKSSSETVDFESSCVDEVLKMFTIIQIKKFSMQSAHPSFLRNSRKNR